MLVQLDALGDSLSAAINEMTDNTAAYPTDFQDTVDDLLVLLQKTQNYKEEETEQEMLDALKGNLKAFRVLNNDIDAYTARLASVSANVQKVASTVGTIVSILTTVVSSGIV